MTTATRSGTVAIVTGAGSGIGAATARRLAADGSTVILTGRTRDKLDDVVSRGADLPGAMHARVVDSADERQITTLIDDVVSEFGRLDTLVNNAAVAGEGGPVTETSDEDWSAVMRIDVDGVFYGCRAAIPHLARNGGSIVNVTSVSGLGGDWKMAAYNAAKGAVVNLTRSMALDHGADGVRVNAVSPSFTYTDMNTDMAEDTDLMNRFVDRIPMGRGAQPEEIADAIAFLAGPDARFVTGVNLPVDGGLTASNGQPRM